MNTNNNWEEELKSIVNDIVGWRNAEILNERLEHFISNLLTKKDQEHKAELIEIKWEIGKEKVNTHFEHGDDAMKCAISILDSHINKQTL